MIAALQSHSIALFSDSLDAFGDAFAYGLSLWALHCHAKTKARVALLKGALIFLAASFVIFHVIYRLYHPIVPEFGIMGLFAAISLIGNALCVYFLARHRSDDINMSSVFECSFNDMVASASVIVAAFFIWFFDSHWPDIIIGSLLAVFLLKSSFKIIASALFEILD